MSPLVPLLQEIVLCIRLGEINGRGALDSFLKESTYEKWLDKLLSDIDIDNPQDSKAPELT